MIVYLRTIRVVIYGLDYFKVKFGVVLTKIVKTAEQT